MSESTGKIEKCKREILADLYLQLTERQRGFFNRLYESTDLINDDRIDHAIDQCERTIKKNIELGRK